MKRIRPKSSEKVEKFSKIGYNKKVYFKSAKKP